MNNPFGLPDEVFNAILESAFTGTVKIPSQAKDKKAGSTPVVKLVMVAPVEDGAKAAKKIYDSYVAAGFNEVQAFELLKLVLSK